MTEHKIHILKSVSGEIPFFIRRSSRRRTMELSVTTAALARVTAPRFVSLGTIEQFVLSRRGWVLRRMQEKKIEEERIQSRKFQHGHEFLFLGQWYPLCIQSSEHHLVTRLQFQDGHWLIRANPSASEKTFKTKLLAWYRREAGEIFAARVFHFSRIMQLTPKKITVKTQKRLWGSCNHQGKSINLNWILVMAPQDVIDYVIVHELSHLEVPNHSQRFWRKVAAVLPDYLKSEAWLKKNVSHMRLP